MWRNPCQESAQALGVGGKGILSTLWAEVCQHGRDYTHHVASRHMSTPMARWREHLSRPRDRQGRRLYAEPQQTKPRERRGEVCSRNLTPLRRVLASWCASRETEAMVTFLQDELTP